MAAIPFPQPTFPAGSMNHLNAEGPAFYHSGSAPGSAHNLNIHLPVPHTGRAPSRSPSPYPYTTHQGPHPAFPMPPGQGFQAVYQRSPSPYFPEQDIPYSQPHLGVSGADQFHAGYQIDPGHLDSPMDYGEHEAPAIHDDHRLAKGPPTPSIAVGPRKDNRPNNRKPSMLARVFGKPAVEHPVKDPQLILYRCRSTGCPVPVRSDQVGRLGGFCCDTQMWDAVHNRLATLCRCQRRVCLEGQSYCSAHCANGVVMS
ncbi:hypothetical protein V8E53_006002 [Lactarius tabidus]